MKFIFLNPLQIDFISKSLSILWKLGFKFEIEKINLETDLKQIESNLSHTLITLY